MARKARRRRQATRGSRTAGGCGRGSSTALAPTPDADSGKPSADDGLTPRAASPYDPPAVSQPTGDEPTMPSFGETLRRQRELRQISLREVSEATKINIRYLEALERNDFTHLPGGAFTRGYIRSFARVIGVDETEMVDAYLYELSQQDGAGDCPVDRGAQTETLARHFSLPGGNEEERRRRARLLVITALALLLLAVVAGGSWGLHTWLERSESGTQVQETLTP